MGLFDRFRRKGSNAPPKRSIVDEPLIGSELFEGRPVSAHEYFMPLRKKIQAEYRAEGRDPESLEKVPSRQRNEQFWEMYIDSLMVFERKSEALNLVKEALSRYPNNSLLREAKSLLEISGVG